MHELEKAKAAGAIRQSSDRNFGQVMAAFFLLASLLSAWKHEGKPLWYWPVLCVTFALFAFFAPRALHPLNLAWSLLGRVLHMVMSPLVMGLLYFGFFTPFGLVFRLIKGDPLRLKLKPSAATYWIQRAETDQPGSGMGNQF